MYTCITYNPLKYACGFPIIEFCLIKLQMNIPISFRVSSLALWQSNPISNEAAPKNMDNSHKLIMEYESTDIHNSQNKPIYILDGM